MLLMCTFVFRILRLREGSHYVFSPILEVASEACCPGFNVLTVSSFEFVSKGFESLISIPEVFCQCYGVSRNYLLCI
jgi:hypothetical protein